ncbi:MAG: hypothetical protein WC654_00755 [Patescibacteria group bacterium]
MEKAFVDCCRTALEGAVRDVCTAYPEVSGSSVEAALLRVLKHSEDLFCERCEELTEQIGE